jgi:hypothetical protein
MSGKGNPKGYIPWNTGKKGTYKNVQYHIKENGEVWGIRKNRCYLVNGCITNKGYRSYTINGKSIEGHRLVAEKYLSNPNNYPQVDHINRVRHDNRVKNLRWVTRQQNCDNRIFGGTEQQAIDYLQSLGYTITKDK